MRRQEEEKGEKRGGRGEERLTDWYCDYGATTPSHLGHKLTGPLCTAFSSARQPHRRSTSSDMRTLWYRRTKMGEKWPTNFAWKTRLPRSFQGSLTCRKSATWDRWLYFPSEGRRAEDFFAQKIRRLRPGLNPRSWVPEASTLTTRPPKPLWGGERRKRGRRIMHQESQSVSHNGWHITWLCVIRPGQIRNNVKGSSHGFLQSVIRRTQYNATAEKSALHARSDTETRICTCRIWGA
jgi:hypothetical protein